MSGANQVHVARLFVAGILAFTYLLSLVTDRSIFRLGVWSFTGFAALFPVVVAALYWRRSTRQGALAAIGVTAALWVVFFVRGGDVPGYTVGGTGIMPVAVIAASSALALTVVSWLTPPPPEEVVERFFTPFESGSEGAVARSSPAAEGTA
jgi:SSS family solute:Na+ symporter